MFSGRVLPLDLHDRLDAGFYRPDHLRHERLLRRQGAVQLQSLVKSIACGPFGGNAIADELYANEGVIFVRPVNISSNVFDDSTLARVPKALLAKNGLKVYTGTNLYFGRVGVPCVAVLDGETSISPNIIIAAPEQTRADPHYLYAFAASNSGMNQLQRQLKEVAQPTTSTDAIRELLILACREDAQRYIGDKVRQAERLRAWAKGLEVGFTVKLQAEMPEAFTDRRTGRKHSTAAKQDISYTLNPGAFDEERLRVQKYLKSCGGRELSSMANIKAAATPSYAAQARYIGLDAISSNSCQLRPESVSSAGVTGSCRVLLEGPVVAKLRPYLNKVGYIPSWLTGSFGSTELLCVQPKGDLSGWYLYGVLKSEATLKQLRPLASGATHPRIDSHDLYHIVVPVLAHANELGEMLAQAQAGYFYSGFLTTAAKRLVEALIEGGITESQLIAAQQALEAGDDSQDRAILARLKTDGLDGAGEPLFPDLDQLYNLLERAKVEAEA